MSNEAKPVGGITWTDLTVPNADEICDFYNSVVGWEPSPLDMGGYDDFVLKMPEDGTPVAGICYARGSNAVLPPYWLVYITVKDLEQSEARCVELGGKIVMETREMTGHGRYCVIQDPAGAFAALFQFI